MSTFTASMAHAWGRAIARYALWTVESAQIHVEGKTNIPTGPVIFAGWHTTNLIAMALYHTLHRSRASHSFVPSGLVGAAMSGWVEGCGIKPVSLPKDGTSNVRVALRQMTGALARGSDVGIALDGPHGPAGQVRPGALWLARSTGCPLVPMALAAQPALRVPRWDRHLVPLPGARITAVFSAPVWLERNAKIDEPRLEELGSSLNETTRRAWELLAWGPRRTPELDRLPNGGQ
jgi:3-deoxy-D-manno-octulosonic-acid transferase